MTAGAQIDGLQASTVEALEHAKRFHAQPLHVSGSSVNVLRQHARYAQGNVPRDVAKVTVPDCLWHCMHVCVYIVMQCVIL